MSDTDPTVAPGGPSDEAAEHASAPPPGGVPHAGARYALLRVLTLIAFGGVFYIVGLRGLLWAFSAVLASGIASYFLFMKQRNDAAANLQRTMGSWKQRRSDEAGFDESEELG